MNVPVSTVFTGKKNSAHSACEESQLVQTNPGASVLCAPRAAQSWSVPVQPAWRAGGASACVSAKGQRDRKEAVIMQVAGTLQRAFEGKIWRREILI